MKKVALVTYSRQPELFDGDNLLPQAFAYHGYMAEAVPWDIKVNWQSYDLVILRSCWNYHTKITQFLNWINELESLGINLLNPRNVIIWNMNKKYLLDLEKKGVNIVPTVDNIHQVPKSWKEIIIKPFYGASSYKIRKIKREELQNYQLENTLIQPFLEEISRGEISFIFINKKFSHAVNKIPKKQEFRSQREFGGLEISITPPDTLILEAQSILKKIPSPLLYARIDGIILEGHFFLMELEVIEPYLFFEKKEKSAELFAAESIKLA